MTTNSKLHALADDGRVVSTDYYELRVWDVLSLSDVLDHINGAVRIFHVWVLRDGRVVTASMDCVVRVWSI